MAPFYVTPKYEHPHYGDPQKTPWCLGGNGGMDYRDCWGVYRDYYMDPFPHSLLSTREKVPLILGTLKSCSKATAYRLCYRLCEASVTG